MSVEDVACLINAARNVHGRGVRGLVEDKDNDNCWLILMDKKAWADLRDALDLWPEKP
ncbi:MAG: hypothetical protein MUP81_02580 [Dehalococcoidia bacterium]|nr:hypothetical protein [Dehalococcoidia bacterium]